MKKYLKSAIITVILFISQIINGQDLSKPVYVIVHGAWGGGWAFKKVDSLLTAKGCIAYRPTMTGQGERVHLASSEIRLNTHINDITNLILYENISDIILVGHSYGGMVVTGVADSLPERIKKLIYVDAFLPENGESAAILGGLNKNFVKISDKGLVGAPWVNEAQSPPKNVPHPLKTLTDTILLDNPLREGIPTTYILTVDKGKEPKGDNFFKHMERAKSKDWKVLFLEADHNPQWSAPEAFVDMLLGIGTE